MLETSGNPLALAGVYFMITELLILQNQIRVYHWQTDSYAQHIAFDRTYEALDDQIDKFVEVFSGKYGKVVDKNGFTIKLESINDEAIVPFVDKNITYLTTILPKSFKETDTDLQNIRDEMLATLHQLKYLLTLN